MSYSMSLFFGYEETEGETSGTATGGYDDTKLKGWVQSQIVRAKSSSQTYTDTQIATSLPLAGGQMKGDINMDTNEITGLPHHYSDDTNAVSKKYIATNYVRSQTHCRLVDLL